MTQFTSQFAIINKIKSIVKKTGGLFTPKDNGITTAIARKIQKTAYDVSRLHEKDAYTAPYLWIAEELQSKDIQIFKASVFYLAEIALSQPRYADHILEILKKNQSSVPGEQAAYIRDKIAFIQKNRR